MPVIYPRRYSTTGSTFLPPSGSTYRLSTYSSTSSSTTSTGNDRSSSSYSSSSNKYSSGDSTSTSNYLSRSSYRSPLGRSSLLLGNDSSASSSRYGVSKYRTSADKDLLPPSGASASRYSRSDSKTRDHSYTSASSSSSSSLARQVATSGIDLYEKYSPSNYTPKCELTRSRSLTDSSKLNKERTTPTRDSSAVIGGNSSSATSGLGSSSSSTNSLVKVKKSCAPTCTNYSNSSSTTCTTSTTITTNTTTTTTSCNTSTSSINHENNIQLINNNNIICINNQAFGLTTTQSSTNNNHSNTNLNPINSSHHHHHHHHHNSNCNNSNNNSAKKNTRSLCCVGGGVGAAGGCVLTANAKLIGNATVVVGGGYNYSNGISGDSVGGGNKHTNIYNNIKHQTLTTSNNKKSTTNANASLLPSSSSFCLIDSIDKIKSTTTPTTTTTTTTTTTGEATTGGRINHRVVDVNADDKQSTAMTTNSNYNNNISDHHHRGLSGGIGSTTTAKNNILLNGGGSTTTGGVIGGGVNMKATNDFNAYPMQKGGSGNYFSYQKDLFKPECDLIRNKLVIKQKKPIEINNNATVALANGLLKASNNNMNGVLKNKKINPLVQSKISQLLNQNATETNGDGKPPPPTLAELKLAASRNEVDGISKSVFRIKLKGTTKPTTLKVIDKAIKPLNGSSTPSPPPVIETTKDVKINKYKIQDLEIGDDQRSSSPLSDTDANGDGDGGRRIKLKISNHHEPTTNGDDVNDLVNGIDCGGDYDDVDDELEAELEKVYQKTPLNAMAIEEKINCKLLDKDVMSSSSSSLTSVDTKTDSVIRNGSLRTTPTSSSSSKWERDRPTSIATRTLSDSDSFALSKSAYSSSSSLADPYDKASTASSEPVEGLCGLRNIGNTCFMNSVLQCLSHTNELVKYVKAQQAPKTSSKDQKIFAEFVKLIKEMWSATTKSVTPSDLKHAISSKYRMYSGSAQQDAQEFLRFFLDTLHSALNAGAKGGELKIDDNMSDSKKADLTWEWYSKVENSLIKDLFVGQLKSSLKCTVCGNTSVTFDPFWDLSVPLPSATRCKLENCLELFIKEEVLDGDEMPTCSKCETRRKCTKSFTIQRFPKYLVIHLKRFSETRWSKLTNIVEFPTGERDLDMSPYASSTNSSSATYSLYGISNHMGSTAGGHYVAVCKHPSTKKWHDFNDNYVSDSSESHLISSSAYLLFYERSAYKENLKLNSMRRPVRQINNKTSNFFSSSSPNTSAFNNLNSNYLSLTIDENYHKYNCEQSRTNFIFKSIFHHQQQSHTNNNPTKFVVSKLPVTNLTILFNSLLGLIFYTILLWIIYRYFII